MSNKVALTGCRIFDGRDFHDDAALVVTEGEIQELVALEQLGEGVELQELQGGTLLPGFVDLQVNGGGGCQFNDDPSVEAIETICSAHAALGTTSLMPTLITDTVEKTRAAVEAAKQAQKQGTPGFLGLHLEGPHLSAGRKGAHDPALIRKMSDDDLDILCLAATEIENLMITVAPETVQPDQMKQLAGAGAIVSLGHSNCTYETAIDASKSGASCVTHLFNAMSPLTHREPGLVGAALQSGDLFCGLIADGYHVDVAAIRIALAAKVGPGRVFLVSDAMSPTGSAQKTFKLGGRTIYRKDGRLTLEDGTLAGADLDMASALKFMVESVGADLSEAARMASLYPAQCLKRQDRLGHLAPGTSADLVHVDDDLSVRQVWRAGSPVL